MEGVLTVVHVRWMAEKPGYATRWGTFRLIDPMRGAELESGGDLPPALSRLDLRLAQEPRQPPSAATFTDGK